MAKEKLVGKYGMLTVYDFFENDKKEVICKCICDCGKEKNIRWKSIIQKTPTFSCGCYQVEISRLLNTKHGLTISNKKLYDIINAIFKRCENKNNKDFKHYGGRGISVCKEWRDYTAFVEWALSNGYKEGLQIDRIDNDSNYEPSNCRWVTQLENKSIGRQRVQSNNKTGYVGVHLRKKSIKYISSIKINKKHIIIGYFYSLDDAVKARIKCEIDNFGEQKTNFNYRKGYGDDV